MSTTYSYTLPTVKGTQVKYYTATSNNEKIGILSTSNTGFSIVNVPAGTSNYVLNYNGTSNTLSFIAQTEVSTDTDVPKIETVSGALYIQNNGGAKTWQKFDAGILVSNLATSTVTGVTASDDGDYVIKYQNGTYSLTTYTAVNITYPSGILVGSNGNGLSGITASKNGEYVITYSSTVGYSLTENVRPTYQNGILVGNGSSNLSYIAAQQSDFDDTADNYYLVKVSASSIGETPSSYSLSKLPLDGLLYANSNGINSVNISAPGNYVLKYSNNNTLSTIALPTNNSGIITYDADTSAYGCINAMSGTYYLKGIQTGSVGNYSFILENAFFNNANGINYAANGAGYIQNVMRFEEIENNDDASACYIINATNEIVENRGNILTLNAQIINPGFMYGTSDHEVLYASFPEEFDPNDQYVIKYDSNDASLRLSSFTATASVSVPTSGILVGGANNVISSIKPSTNVNDTFVINFAQGTTGVNDGTYSLTSLNTLLPTITTSFGSPFLFNLAGSQESSTFVTLTNEDYYCSTQVSIPTYALKTDSVQTRVDVEGIYRVNFNVTTSTTLTVDPSFSSSIAFPNDNMVDLTFILAFKDSYVRVGTNSGSSNTLAVIDKWGGDYAAWNANGYAFKTYANNRPDYLFMVGDNDGNSTPISMTDNISAIPITNSPPFEYRYFKTSLYFAVNDLTKATAVTSSTPKLYIFYGYSDNIAELADGVSIANVNITVYSSTL